MDPDLEIERTVKENRRLIEENNKMLKKINRSLAISAGIKIVYWIVILGVAFGAYYIVQPYVDSFKDTYSDVRGGVENVKSLGGERGSFEESISTLRELLQ